MNGFRGLNFSDAIFPIYLGNVVEEEFQSKEYLGTGFYIDGIGFITCLHCVDLKKKEENNSIVIIVQEQETLKYTKCLKLENEIRLKEINIAIYKINLPPPKNPLIVPEEEIVTLGTDIWTYGYPRSDKVRLEARMFKGYIQRHFVENENQYIEVDLHVPAGLSGSPLIMDGSGMVLGIMQGAVDVGITVEFASLDNGVKTPEIQKIYTYGRALDIFSLLKKVPRQVDIQ